MPPEQSVTVFAIQLAGMTIGTLAALVFFLQRHLNPVYGMSALLFLAFMLSQLHVLSQTLLPNLPHVWSAAVHMVSYAATFFIAPAFLFQVRLFSASRPIDTRQIAKHLALPAIATFFCVLFLCIPIDTRQALSSGVDFAEAPQWIQITILSLFALEPVVYTQWLVYVTLVFLDQRRHRARLKQVFASTERHEMFWVTGMAAVLAIYALESLASFVLRHFGHGDLASPALDSSIVVLFIVLLTVRGLRQAPGLYELEAAATSFAEDETRTKYSKSALAEDHAQRIARKLNRAMVDEHLYRDPNLSLTRLSQHIGSSSNYVSQTLNEHLQQSFFDFVNKWRIDEAKVELASSNATILEIAYQVGFNSRSAFYAAFKKHALMTPTQFRSKLAAPAKQGLIGHAASSVTP